MKKSKKTAMVAAAFAVAMGLTACIPPAEDKDIEVRRKSDGFTGKEDVEVVYGPPEDFEPSESEVYDVYGPAPDFDDYDPTTEEVYDVYGPAPDTDGE